MAQAIAHADHGHAKAKADLCAIQHKKFDFKAPDLSIAGGNDCRYWTWEKSCDEYAKLKEVFWLDVKGKIHSSKLASFVPYEAVFELELTPCAQGWCKPINLELNVLGQCARKWQVCINDKKGHKFELSLGPIETHPHICGDMSFKFYEHSNNNKKTGLIVKKAIVRPISKDC